MILINSECLNMGKLMFQTYQSKYESPEFSPEIFADKDTFDDLSGLFQMYKGFEPTFAPNVVMSAQGTLQKVIPLQGYRKDGVLFVMWGGFSHKDHWFEVPKGSYEVDVFNGASVAVIDYCNLAVNLVEEPANSGKELTKASKLSALEVGEYKIDSAKLVHTKYGDTYIVTIGGREYWANNQLLDLIAMIGGADNVKGLTLRVIDKGTTKSGYLTVIVGLSK